MMAARSSQPATAGLSRGSRWLDILMLAAVIITYYLLLNWQFSGPTYLGDEIGYLSNAAFIAGSRIDGSSSYHFGYSLFLVPSYLLFSDTAAIWKSVLVTNALIFSAAFSVLYLIGEYLCANRWHRIGYVLLAAAYPAYPIMSGYAYSQPAFVLVFLLSCFTLLRYPRTSYPGQLMFGFLVGFLYWVHPTALAVMVAAAIVGLASVASDLKTLRPALLSVFVAALMIAAYKLLLHPSLMDAMTPEGFEAKKHYPAISEKLLAVLSFSAAVDFLTRFLGQLSYVIVSTLSILTVGLYVFPNILMSKNGKIVSIDINRPFYIFVLFSFIFLLFTVSAFFLKDYGSALNTWFYGRYLEGLLLPILFISLVHRMDRRTNALISLSIIISFIVLFSFSGFTRTWLNLINISAFWPAILPIYDGVLWWFAAGAIGCALAIAAPRPVQISLLVVLFGLCTAEQINWHRGSFGITSTPSELPEFVRRNLEPGSCIGIGSGPEDRNYFLARERFNLYSYYLYDYRYERMTPERWAATCDGYYLSYQDADELAALGAVQVGMEVKTRLFVYAKSFPKDADRRSYGPYFVQRLPADAPDRFALGVSAAEILQFRGVGAFGDDMLQTTGKAGFLFYGPYIHVAPGPLKFKVFGIANDVDGAWIDIASDGGRTIHAKFPVQQTNGKIGVLADGEFALPKAVRDFEIRLKVHEDSDIQFQHYDLILPN